MRWKNSRRQLNSLKAASGIAQCRITGAQIRQYVLAMTDDEQVDEVRAWFASKGFDVRVEERDMSDELGGPTAKHGFWVDLVSRRSGCIAHYSYGSGPSATLAIVAAEQRWLVEQDGSGSTAGATYADKARERLRRMRETAP